MIFGVLSDTHGHLRPVQEAIDVLRARKVHLVIHCGDVGTSVVPLFKGLETHFVAGNTDHLEQLGSVIVEPEHRFHNPLGTLEVSKRKVAFLHGHDSKLLRETVRGGEWDLVCHGHSHVYSLRREGPTLVLNPGALWRTSEPSVATVDLRSLEIHRIML